MKGSSGGNVWGGRTNFVRIRRYESAGFHPFRLRVDGASMSINVVACITHDDTL